MTAKEMEVSQRQEREEKEGYLPTMTVKVSKAD